MYRIGQLATQLNISPSMVRSLTLEWKDCLSEEAGNPALLEDGRRAVCRYNDEDLEILQSIMQLRDQGLNDEEIKAHLKGIDDNHLEYVAESVLEERRIPRHEELGQSVLRQALDALEKEQVFLNKETEEAQPEDSTSPIMKRIGQVAVYLDISPFRLRQLSQRFADWLSEAALGREQRATTSKVLENGQAMPYLYDEEDVEILQIVLELQRKGLSDDEIEEQLEEMYADDTALLALREEGTLMNPAAMRLLGQALHQLSETQQALLNTQQSHRDLLSVVIKDAMSFKEENERLRKRLRMIEEEMARLKESDWNHRLALEERLNDLTRQKEQKRSWWERLLGE